MVKNNSLYEKLALLTKSAFSIYNDPNGNLPPGEHLMLNNNSYDKKISDLAEFGECVRLMENDKEIKRLLNMAVGTRTTCLVIIQDTYQCILQFIKRYYQKNTTYSEDLFNRYYLLFEDLFYSDSFSLKDSSKLHNFQCDRDKINLSNEINITRTEVCSTLEGKNIGTHHMDACTDSGFYIVRKYREEKIYGQQDPKLSIPDHSVTSRRVIFDDVVNALRLLKHSDIFRGRTIATEFTTFHPSLSVIYNSLKSSYGDPGETCVINNKNDTIALGDLGEIFHFIQSAHKNKKDNRFLIALRRLSSGMSECYDEDKLLDYMIGLEALYLPGINQELTFRLALNVALASELDKQKRKDIYKFIKKMYGYRSKISHGNQLKGNDFRDDVVKLEEVLRNSLKLWINDRCHFDDCNLEDRLFSLSSPVC